MGRYLFVSSVNVYASHRELDQDEGRATAAATRVGRYGIDRAVRPGEGRVQAGGDRGVRCGSHADRWSGRSGYWPWRFARPSNPGRAVLVPDAPELPTAVIDVRDLAAWLVTCAEAGRTGVFNAGGIRMPLADHLALARTVAGHTGPLVSASTGWLVEHGVQNWSGPTSLPLWLDDSEWYGASARDTSRARAAGLLNRPLQQTLADTLTWELSRPQPGPHGAGLTDEEEQNLLDALATDR